MKTYLCIPVLGSAESHEGFAANGSAPQMASSVLIEAPNKREARRAARATNGQYDAWFVTEGKLFDNDEQV